MARYPTLEDYSKRGNYEDGIKRCNDLLKKSPNDVQLLIVKLQLCYAAKQDADPILQQLLSIQPPILHLRELVTIEEAVWSPQSEVYPVAKTAGAAIAKLWDNALKTFTASDHKLDLLSLRFSRAIVDNRLMDAQQALIQFKALQPKNRVVYMAHAAITQLLSSSREDLSSRLALSLARKAVTEKFDDDQSLDCRVPGQIFALQNSAKDIESVKDRRFKESKQVYEALHRSRAVGVNGIEIPQAPSEDQEKVAPAEWLRTEVEDLKRQFALLIESSAPSEGMLAFALNSLRLFHTATVSISDRKGRSICDACFLSISAWIRIFEQTNQLRYLLIAAFLAETLLKQNTHIHEARLILVYLYMRLGLGSLALQMFDSLSVKEIQHDTVGHALFTRLSLTHPHSAVVNKNNSIDPLKRTAHALGVYTRHEEKLGESEASVLSHGQTGMIFDLHELRDKLRSSLARRMTHLEHRRICRLLDAPGDDLTYFNPLVTANWLEATDNRDFAETFDYGYNVEKVLHGCSGALPGKTWILYTLATDMSWSIAAGLAHPVKDIPNLLQELENIHLEPEIGHLHLSNEASPSSSLGLTDAEYLAGNLAHQILKLYWDIISKRSDMQDAADRGADSLRKALEALNIDALLRTKDVLTEHLQDCFVYLDVLRIMAKPSQNSKAPQANDASAKIRQFHEHARLCFSSIQRHAKEQAERIDAKSIREYIKQEDDVREGLALFGDEALDDFCKTVAESAKEGWKGLTEIRLE